MRILMYVMFLSLLISCGSTDRPDKKRGESIINSESISLIINEDNNVLKDSISYMSLVHKIVLQKELNNNNELPSATISDEIYRFVYETPDSIVSLSRKMDLIQMLVYYCRHTTDYYIGFITSKIDEKNDTIMNRPFLLFPFIYTAKISPSIINCILRQDSIQVPKEYFQYSCNVKEYLNSLPKNNLKKEIEKIRSNTYISNPNTQEFLSKRFQVKYNWSPDWTIK